MKCRMCGKNVPETADDYIAHVRKHDEERQRLGFSRQEYDLLCYSRMLAG